MPPTTFGLKAAGWLDAILRHRERFDEPAPRACAPARRRGGTLAVPAPGARGGHGARRRPGPALPDIAWHSIATASRRWRRPSACSPARSARSRATSRCTARRRWRARSPSRRRGGSRRCLQAEPGSAAVVLAVAARAPGLVATMLGAMIQEDERGARRLARRVGDAPELVGYRRRAPPPDRDDGGRTSIRRAWPTSRRRTARPRKPSRWLSRRPGAAAQRLRRRRAAGAGRGRHPRDARRRPDGGPARDPDELERLFDPRRYIGAADALVERVLARHAAARARAPEETAS